MEKFFTRPRHQEAIAQCNRMPQITTTKLPYGGKEDTKEVVDYIRMENKLGLFTEEFKKEMDGLLLGATAEV